MRPHDLFRWTLALLAGATLLASSQLAAQNDDDDDDDDDAEATPCEKTAAAIRTAALNAANQDFWIGIANCTNVSRRRDALACLRENLNALGEALDQLAEQLDARLDLCDFLGGGQYDPRIDPRDFVRRVTNPFLPLTPGLTKVFQQVSPEGTETIEVTTTHDTKMILGVECVVVRDLVRREDEVIEDTLDYFAQDRSGNVWYFGELVMNFEDGELHDLSGSWTAGVDGAKPGIVMKAAPSVGNVYRQEFLPNEAEDAARVTGQGRAVRVPAGNFRGCLETLDFTPIEPGHLEAKFYAPGVGFVMQVTLETGERTELIAIR